MKGITITVTQGGHIDVTVTETNADGTPRSLSGFTKFTWTAKKSFFDKTPLFSYVSDVDTTKFNTSDLASGNIGLKIGADVLANFDPGVYVTKLTALPADTTLAEVLRQGKLVIANGV